MKKNLFRLASFSLLPFLIFITSTHLIEDYHWVSYAGKIFFLLSGPLPLIIFEYDILFFTSDKLVINYFWAVQFLFMIFCLVVGLFNLKNSILHKILFTVGLLIWFWFGLIYIGLHYVTA